MNVVVILKHPRSFFFFEKIYYPNQLIPVGEIILEWVLNKTARIFSPFFKKNVILHNS